MNPNTLWGNYTLAQAIPVPAWPNCDGWILRPHSLAAAKIPASKDSQLQAPAGIDVTIESEDIQGIPGNTPNFTFTQMAISDETIDAQIVTQVQWIGILKQVRTHDSKLTCDLPISFEAPLEMDKYFFFHSARCGFHGSAHEFYIQIWHHSAKHPTSFDFSDQNIVGKATNQ